MSDLIVTLGTSISCPHAIPAVIAASGSKLLVVGTPAAMQGDTATVSGCPFTIPGPKAQPCVTAELTKTAAKVTSGGVAVLLVNPSDLCKSADQVTNGPITWAAPQSKVMAK